MSIPLWERVLKSFHFPAVLQPYSVAPLVGARIEIMEWADYIRI